VVLTSHEVNLFERLLAWKETWVKTGRRPESTAIVEHLFDYGTVEELVQYQPEHLTSHERTVIERLYADAVPVKQIAEQFGINRRTVRRVAKQAGLQPQPRGLSEAQIDEAVIRPASSTK
jgi:DNA-directed RNA polymerase specialized sigma subunit